MGWLEENDFGYTLPRRHYMLKVNNRNTRTRCKICSKCFICFSKCFIVKCVHMLFQLLTRNLPVIRENWHYVKVILGQLQLITWLEYWKFLGASLNLRGTQPRPPPSSQLQRLDRCYTLRLPVTKWSEKINLVIQKS